MGSISIALITLLKLIFGNATPLFNARMEITDSIIPAAPRVCPVNAFVELKIIILLFHCLFYLI
jgi:hypothetical protein